VRQLTQVKTEYQGLDAEYAKEKQFLHSKARELQLNRFLDQFFIDKAKISGIGSARKATLASFGIETAADIEYSSVLMVPGIGQHLAGQLVAWRKSYEQKFVFDAGKGINPQDLATLNRKYTQHKAHLEHVLLAGFEQLTQIRESILRKREVFKADVENAAQTLAQAKADMTIF